MVERRKPIVVFLSLADFAASSYNACQAVNKIGRIEAHHITLSYPPYNFPAEIVCPIAFKNFHDLSIAPNYARIRELINSADLLHLWNNEREGFPMFANLQIPYDKVKSYTFTGTSYRIGHVETNRNIGKLSNSRVIVQDPLFLRFLNEFPLEFIPHAVDTELLKFTSISQRIPNTIGYYNKADQDYKNCIHLLQQIVKRNHPEVTLVAGKTVKWWDRLQELAKCMFFFQNLSSTLGTPGRSSWEAMAMGMPTFTCIHSDVHELAKERFEGLPILSATVQTFEKVLADTLKRIDYKELSKATRDWVVDKLGYDRVGEEYTKLFKELL